MITVYCRDVLADRGQTRLFKHYLHKIICQLARKIVITSQWKQSRNVLTASRSMISATDICHLALRGLRVYTREYQLKPVRKLFHFTSMAYIYHIIICICIHVNSANAIVGSMTFQVHGSRYMAYSLASSELDSPLHERFVINFFLIQK